MFGIGGALCRAIAEIMEGPAVAPSAAQEPEARIPILARPFVMPVLGLLLVAGWTGSVLWSAFASDEVPGVIFGGAMLFLSLFFLHSEARLLTSEMKLRKTTEEKLLQTEARALHLEARLESLTTSNETMYSLLFKGRRLSVGSLWVDESKSRVEDPREYLLEPPLPSVINDDILGEPSKVFPSALDGMRYDHVAAHRAAKHIRDPKYSLQQFYVDVRQGFPELSLYVAQRSEALAGHTTTTSGVSAADEYRRTLGALFAVYWLARVGIDGPEGFCFGVDEKWRPRQVPNDEGLDELDEPNKRRLALYRSQKWELLQQLLIDAGTLTRHPGRLGNDGTVTVNVERMLALLACTAIHDIMKVDVLLPKVQMNPANIPGSPSALLPPIFHPPPSALRPPPSALHPPPSTL